MNSKPPSRNPLNCDNLLSLVAIENENIVAHILFSPVEIKGQHGLSK
jgi:predicted N-acetyltransferase YhbS